MGSGGGKTPRVGGGKLRAVGAEERGSAPRAVIVSRAGPESFRHRLVKPPRSQISPCEGSRPPQPPPRAWLGLAERSKMAAGDPHLRAAGPGVGLYRLPRDFNTGVWGMLMLNLLWKPSTALTDLCHPWKGDGTS